MRIYTPLHHDFRSQLIQSNGGNIYPVADLGGHKNVATRKYAHFSDKNRLESMELAFKKRAQGQWICDQSVVNGPVGVRSWRPQRDLNSRRRRERPVSWARLDDGDVLSFFNFIWNGKVSREGIEPSTT